MPARRTHGAGHGGAAGDGGARQARPAANGGAEALPEASTSRPSRSVGAFTAVVLAFAIAAGVVKNPLGFGTVGFTDTAPDGRPVEDKSARPRSVATEVAKKKAWWVEGDFSHRHLLTITTLNFNETVNISWQAPLLIAFYDPRSASFRELKPELVATATALAEKRDAGQVVGFLGACDVTVHTFLANQEAPEMYTGWQETRPGPFKFGRPRFFPLIVIGYLNGRRQGEYTGVVSAEQIVKFLTRLQAPRGGEVLSSHHALHTFLARPGPFVFGCAIAAGSREADAFNQTAHRLHGVFTFGTMTAEMCTETFGRLAPPWPKVVWLRDGDQLPASDKPGGFVRSTANASLLGNGTELAGWLSSHRKRMMEEMTPDTSHVYLERDDPLVIFLVDPDDSSARRSWESLVAEVEAEQQSEQSGGDYQFVWSNCRTFGAQFDGQCPAVVLVETLSMKWEKIRLQDLESPRASNEPGAAVDPWADPSRPAASRLLAWMQNKSAPWRRSPGPGPGAGSSPSGTGGPSTDPASSSSESKVEQVAVRENDDEAELPGPTPSEDVEWYLSAVPYLFESKLSTSALFRGYHGLLEALVSLRNSFEATYPHLRFDFGDLVKVQKADPRMRMLADRPEVIQHAMADRLAMKRLWADVEARAELLYELRQNGSKISVDRAFAKKLHRGYLLLRDLFIRLFKELHQHASATTLGVPADRKRPVERRAAVDLSVREFVERYARAGQPVIITGLNLSDAQPWTLDFFRERCNVTANYRGRNDSRQSWGRLQKVGRLPLAEFIATFTTNATRRSWYLHDWSLPRHCPEVFGPAPYRGFTVPKYFAGDYFQRSGFQGFQHSWPSLFIGSEETESAMHIDSGGTNFWLMLLSGRKEWRFYSRKDLINLYSRPLTAHFYPDIFRADPAHFPLLRYAEVYEGVQEAGELIFIPGGNPHGVRNLEAIHGVSMNYVDASNVWVFLWQTLAEDNYREFEMFTDNLSLPHGLRSDQEPLPFGEWKSTRWKDLSYDIL